MWNTKCSIFRVFFLDKQIRKEKINLQNHFALNESQIELISLKQSILFVFFQCTVLHVSCMMFDFSEIKIQNRCQVFMCIAIYADSTRMWESVRRDKNAVSGHLTNMLDCINQVLGMLFISVCVRYCAFVFFISFVLFS